MKIFAKKEVESNRANKMYEKISGGMLAVMFTTAFVSWYIGDKFIAPAVLKAADVITGKKSEKIDTDEIVVDIDSDFVE